MAFLQNGEFKKSAQGVVGCVLAIWLTACGLDAGQKAPPGEAITDPEVAATVDGRKIFIQEVRQRAAQICAAPGEGTHLAELCAMQPGEDVEGRPELFNMALDQLVQQRLFSQEAERRGLDRDPEVRRLLELARERVLADAVYRSLYEEASKPERVETEYRNIERQLSGRPLVTLSHILLPTREAALAALRRLEAGEPFERLAFDLSIDRQSATAGGFLQEMPLDELEPAFRDLIGSLAVGAVGGPLRSEDGWHLVRLNARSQTEAQSLESRRPDIVAYLLSQEVDGLYERLAQSAQIRTITEQDAETDVPSGESVAAPPSVPVDRPAPMGPGALASDGAATGGRAAAQAPTAATPSPAAATVPAPSANTPTAPRPPRSTPSEQTARQSGAFLPPTSQPPAAGSSPAQGAPVTGNPTPPQQIGPTP
ncbi:MAG: peptidylprolyl isomerase [Caulobacterales bacterium]